MVEPRQLNSRPGARVCSGPVRDPLPETRTLRSPSGHEAPPVRSSAASSLPPAGDAEYSGGLLRVTDIKQYLYCPRICYWTYLTPVDKRLPPKVAYGAADHALLARLEERRTLRAYGLSEGQRRFHVRLTSSTLGLTGVLDALLETPEERIPVEYKDTLGGVRLNHRVQLAAYALLLRELLGPPVRRGMVFIIPEQRVQVVRLDLTLEDAVLQALDAMRRTLEREELPPPADRWAKCRDCEFLRFCGDRYDLASQDRQLQRAGAGFAKDAPS